MRPRRPILALVLAALLLAAGCVAVERLDTHSPALRVEVVPVKGLAREVTLVQASDMHGIEFGERESELARLLAGRKVDAAVMTGDILDCPMKPWQPAYDLAAVLTSVTPRVYYLPGNHDPDDLGSALSTHGVTVLETAAPVPLDPADPLGRDVALVWGANAGSIRGAKGAGSRLLVIASHTPPNEGRLAAGAAIRSGTHLFIAGHTHGGQIRLPLIGALAAPTTWDREEGGHPGTNEMRLLPDVRGFLVDGMYERSGQRVYVANGLGVTWIPARFLDRSELVLFRFVPAR